MCRQGAVPRFILGPVPVGPGSRLAQIAGQFMQFDVSRGRISFGIANVLILSLGCIRFRVGSLRVTHGRWRTFEFWAHGAHLQSAHEIVENDPMFRVSRSR
jgi:hypothetical protein